MIMILSVGLSMTAFAATTISSVEAYIDKPIAGRPLDRTAYVPANSRYERYTENRATYGIVTGVLWYDVTDGKTITSTSAVAVEGHVYYAAIYLKAKSGYEFANWNSLPYTCNEKTGTGVSLLTSAEKKSIIAITTNRYTCAKPTLSINGGEAKTYSYNAQATLNASYATANNIVFFNWTIKNADTGETIATYTNPYQKINVTGNLIATPAYKLGTQVKSVAVTDLDAPLPGQSPDYTATVASTEKYQVWTSCPFSGYKNGVRWYDRTAGKEVNTTSGKFEAGHEYSVSVALVSKNGADFINANNVSVNINGEKCDYSAGIFSGYSKLWYISISTNMEFQQVQLDLVKSGASSSYYSKKHDAGSTVEITAPVVSGKIFKGWVIRAGNAVIENANSPTTNITLPSDGTTRVAVLASYGTSTEVLKDIFVINQFNETDLDTTGNKATGNAYLNNSAWIQWHLPRAYYDQGYRLEAKLSVNGGAEKSIPDNSYVTADNFVGVWYDNDLTAPAGRTVTYTINIRLKHPNGLYDEPTLGNTIIVSKTITVTYKNNGNVVKFLDTTVDGQSLGLNPSNVSIPTGTSHTVVHTWWLNPELHSDYTLEVCRKTTAPVAGSYKLIPIVAGENKLEIRYNLQSNTDGAVFSDTIELRLDSSTLTYVMCNNKASFVMQKKIVAKVVKHPESVTVPKGKKATFTVEAVGDGLKYLWYVSDGSKWISTGKTTNTYTMTASGVTKVYCKVTDQYGNSVDSGIANLTIAPAPQITTQPKDMSGFSGDTVKTSITATGDGLTYQWYVKKGNDTPSKHSTVSNFTYVMDANSNGLKVYCVVTDKYGVSVTSKTVTITLKNTVKITSQPVNILIDNGKAINNTVTATGDGLTYQWYYKDTTDSAFKKASDTDKTYNVTMSSAVNGRKIYCVVTDKYGNSEQSITVILKMNPSSTTTATTTTKKTTTATTTTKKTTTATTTTKKTTTATTTTKKTTTATTTTKKTTTATTTTKKTTTASTTKPTTTASTTKPTGGSVNTTVSRLAGAERCETAVEISKASYKKATNVVIASGGTYADALAGVPLAYALDAPILLVRNHTLDEGTLAEIKRLGAKNIYILGGEFAVGANVAETLSNSGYKVNRIAGTDRFGTSLEIAKKLQSISGKPTEIFFVYSHNYPDALAVSGVAAAKECPVIYIADTGKLTDGIAAFVKSSGAKKATIISGPAIVNGAAEGNIKKAGATNVNRIYGANRYETCIKINEAYASVLTGKAICVATGANYPDALAGGVFAAIKKAPLVLVDKKLTDAQRNYISSRGNSNIYIFGGTGVVSSEIENQLKK